MRKNIGLFKAKVAEYNSTLNLNEDDWVEGYIAKKKSKCTSPHAPVWFDEWFMCVPVRNESYEYFEDVEIKIETICECTGLEDNNGKLIWENDIVKVDNWQEKQTVYMHKWGRWTLTNYAYELGFLNPHLTCEVIGNKFDKENN